MKTVWTMPSPNRKEKVFGKHPTQKPIELLERIILASTNEGDLIMDPFAGSSTTGIAAINLGRSFLGVETEAEYIRISIERIQKAIADKECSFDFRKKE